MAETESVLVPGAQRVRTHTGQISGYEGKTTVCGQETSNSVCLSTD